MHLELPQTEAPLNKASEGRDAQWYGHYGHRDTIYERTVDLQGTLNYAKVNPLTRAQMLDWMIEVLSNLSRKFSEATFFKAAQIMDMHLKTSGSALTDQHIHLVGLASMYIGSKYEDIEPLRVTELTRDAAYDKFSPQQLRGKELEVLTSLKFQTSFKTQVEVLDYFYFRIFARHLSDMTQELRVLGRNFCIMTLADVGFNDYDIRYVVLACMVNAGLYLSQTHNTKSGTAIPNLAPLAGQDPAAGHQSPSRADVSRRMKGYVQKECLRKNFPSEIWQLIDYVRAFLKKFPENYAVCRQMCCLFTFDPKYLGRE
jgi:hypothetical protein